jgi:hypothetical protein
VPLPDGQGSSNALFEKRLVDIGALRGQDAHIDFRFRIVKPDSQEPLAMVLDLHERTIVGGLGEAKNGAAINPWMARHNAVGFPGFQQNSRQ